MPPEHFDVLIMGAGLSGIAAAYHLRKLCPNKSYIILEQRERIGGTWHLFPYAIIGYSRVSVQHSREELSDALHLA